MHRDLKLDNIMLREREGKVLEACLVDFGLSVFLPAGEAPAPPHPPVGAVSSALLSSCNLLAGCDITCLKHLTNGKIHPGETQARKVLMISAANGLKDTGLHAHVRRRPD